MDTKIKISQTKNIRLSVNYQSDKQINFEFGSVCARVTAKTYINLNEQYSGGRGGITRIIKFMDKNTQSIIYVHV